jgi:gamma-glutamyltranspeptidase
MVSAADPRAAEAGREILRQGGSAADAALATMVALTVVEPQSSGIGGGSFLVYHDSGRRNVSTYDGREAAPLRRLQGSSTGRRESRLPIATRSRRERASACPAISG